MPVCQPLVFKFSLRIQHSHAFECIWTTIFWFCCNKSFSFVSSGLLLELLLFAYVVLSAPNLRLSWIRWFIRFFIPVWVNINGLLAHYKQHPSYIIWIFSSILSFPFGPCSQRHAGLFTPPVSKNWFSVAALLNVIRKGR